MKKAFRYVAMLAAAGLALLLTACNSGGSNSNNTSNSSAMNLAGTWTVTTVSTQGHGTFTGTAAVTQSGPGVGVDGSTTLSAPMGQVALSESGTALSGTISNGTRASFHFSGTLSNGNLSLSGSAACSPTVNETTSLTGTLTSNKIQGSYTITRPSGCYYSNDAGTFTATKQ